MEHFDLKRGNNLHKGGNRHNGRYSTPGIGVNKHGSHGLHRKHVVKDIHESDSSNIKNPGLHRPRNIVPSMGAPGENEFQEENIE
jgi:hypothetical protein